MDDVEAVAAAVKSARRAVTLALVAAFVAVLVLAIDMTIKRAVIDEAQAARRILDDFKREVVTFNGIGTRPATADSGDVPDTAGHVDDAAGTSAAADPDAGSPARAARNRPGRPAGRADRDGQ